MLPSGAHKPPCASRPFSCPIEAKSRHFGCPDLDLLRHIRHAWRRHLHIERHQYWGVKPERRVPQEGYRLGFGRRPTSMAAGYQDKAHAAWISLEHPFFFELKSINYAGVTGLHLFTIQHWPSARAISSLLFVHRPCRSGIGHLQFNPRFPKPPHFQKTRSGQLAKQRLQGLSALRLIKRIFPVAANFHDP